MVVKFFEVVVHGCRWFWVVLGGCRSFLLLVTTLFVEFFYQIVLLSLYHC